MLKNLLRDITGGYVRLQYLGVEIGKREWVESLNQSRKALIDVRKGKTTEFTKLYKEAQESGGMITYENLVKGEDKFDQVTKLVNKAMKDKTALTKLKNNTVDLIADLNEYIESTTRFAAYLSARKDGKSKMAAAKVSKEVTINFDKQGEWSYALNKLWMFSNAGIQGNYNT